MVRVEAEVVVVADAEGDSFGFGCWCAFHGLRRLRTQRKLGMISRRDSLGVKAPKDWKTSKVMRQLDFHAHEAGVASFSKKALISGIAPRLGTHIARMANGPRACFNERASGEQAGDEGGGEGVEAGSDGVGEEFGRLAGEVVAVVAGDEGGTMGTSREGDGLQRVMSEEVRENGGLIGRATEHGGELREFLVVELEERGGGERVEHDLLREMRGTQVDVEDAQAIRSRGGDELAQGIKRDRRALREAAVAHGIGTGGECEQFRRARDHVPSDVFDDGVARLAAGIQRDGHGAGRMRFERRNEARVESEMSTQMTAPWPMACAAMKAKMHTGTMVKCSVKKAHAHRPSEAM